MSDAQKIRQLLRDFDNAITQHREKGTFVPHVGLKWYHCNNCSQCQIEEEYTQKIITECQKQQDEKVGQLKTELDDECRWLKQLQLALVNQIIDDVFGKVKK